MPAMSAEESKRDARRYMDELYNKGNTAVVFEMLAANFVYRNPAPPITPDREGLIQEMTMVRTAFPDLKVTVDDVLIEGDKGVMRWTMSGTHEGVFYGIAPTHKHVVWSGIAIWRTVDNKLVESWNFLDRLDLLNQIGATSQLALGQPISVTQAQPRL